MAPLTTRLARATAPMVALSPAIYQLVRALMALRSPESSPVPLLWTERSALLTAIGVTGYVTAALMVLTAPWLSRRPPLDARVFEGCAVAGALVGVAGAACR